MDNERFDRLARLFGAGNTRRGLLAGIAKGGAAALLAAVGVTTVVSDDVDAADCGARCQGLKPAGKKRCMSRCRSANQKRAARRRARQLARRRAAAAPYTVVIGVGSVQNNNPCTANGDCASGNCNQDPNAGAVGTCQPCPGVRLCANGTVCCTLDLGCVAGICPVPPLAP